MKNTMIKLLVGAAVITSCLYAGGDIAPVVEPVTEEVKEEFQKFRQTSYGSELQWVILSL